MGDWGVGKESIIQRFVSNETHKLPWKGGNPDFKKIEITVDNKKIKLIMWIARGAMKYLERFMWVRLKEMSGFILVYDITRSYTLENLIYWMEQIRECVKNLNQMPIIVVGNKIELKDVEQTIDQQKIDEILNIINVKSHIFTSAKKCYNIKEIFLRLIRELKKRN